MPVNQIFNDGYGVGTQSEQDILEDLNIEAIQIKGVEMFYIPRITVAIDKILGEDRLSKFEHAYPIEMYLENAEGFEGQGAFLQKFGLTNEYSATFTVSRRRWLEVLEDDLEKVLPNRPAEGDLLYFPLSGGLFEIKFVEDKDPFYQLGKRYVWKLQVELFQYSSEAIDTGVPEIDIFEDLKSFDETINDVEESNSFGDNTDLQTEGDDFIVDRNNPLVGGI